MTPPFLESMNLNGQALVKMHSSVQKLLTEIVSFKSQNMSILNAVGRKVIILLASTLVVKTAIQLL